MDKQFQALQLNLETAVQRADAEGIEFWLARDLQAPLVMWFRIIFVASRN